MLIMSPRLSPERANSNHRGLQKPYKNRAEEDKERQTFDPAYAEVVNWQGDAPRYV